MHTTKYTETKKNKFQNTVIFICCREMYCELSLLVSYPVQLCYGNQDLTTIKNIRNEDTRILQMMFSYIFQKLRKAIYKM